MPPDTSGLAFPLIDLQQNMGVVTMIILSSWPGLSVNTEVP